jgi:hypothetical protein
MHLVVVENKMGAVGHEDARRSVGVVNVDAVLHKSIELLKERGDLLG